MRLEEYIASHTPWLERVIEAACYERARESLDDAVRDLLTKFHEELESALDAAAEQASMRGMDTDKP